MRCEAPIERRFDFPPLSPHAVNTVAIFLFTDFGLSDIYVGQVKAVLAQQAPGVAVIDLAHDVPNFNVRAGAHLLAALATRLAPGSVTMAVIDPGVGSSRHAVAIHADDQWFVGPDNGLLSIIAARAQSAAHWLITWRSQSLSASFHGRDLFAPAAAAITTGGFPGAIAEPLAALPCRLDSGDLPELIYIDHYGNAATGMRAAGVAWNAELAVAGRRLRFARVFAEVAPGELFWYENSLGLIEIAANQCSAALRLGLRVGDPVRLCANDGA